MYFVLLSGSNFFFKCLIISFVSLPFVFDLSVVFFVCLLATLLETWRGVMLWPRVGFSLKVLQNRIVDS